MTRFQFFSRTPGKSLTPSRETEIQFMIQDLHRLGIYEGKNGEQFERMGYYSLRSLLAIARAKMI